MSLTRDLKARLNSIGVAADRERGSLEAYHTKFAAAIAEVNATLEGSSTQEHRTMLMAFQQADQALATATNALRNVATTAKAKSASL